MNILNYINLNGKIMLREDAGIPTDNGAFRYGYGLFETMLVQNGKIILMEYHWERLFDGAKKLHFELPALMTSGWLENETLRTVQKNQTETLCRVRLQLFAGGGGLYSTESKHPGFIIECFPLEPDMLKLNENGLVAGIASGINKSMDSLSNLKSCNALIYAIAAQQAKQNKWNDALICNTNGNIIESTIANIFWIKAGVIYTPPLTEGCVAGVMRRHIMGKLAVTEKSLSLEELLSADEVFLTNAIRKIRWVRSINNAQYRKEQIVVIYNTCFPSTF